VNQFWNFGHHLVLVYFTEVLLPTFPELISGAENFGPVVLCLRGYGRRLGRWVAELFRLVRYCNLPIYIYTMWGPPVISWFRFAPVTSSLFAYHVYQFVKLELLVHPNFSRVRYHGGWSILGALDLNPHQVEEYECWDHTPKSSQI